MLYYSVQVEKGRNTVVALMLDRVKEIKAMNDEGKLPDQLQDPNMLIEEEKLDFADVTGVIELPDVKKRKGKNRRKPGGRNQKGNTSGQQRNKQQGGNRPKQQAKGGNEPEGEKKGLEGQNKKSKNQRRNRGKNRNRGSRPKDGNPPAQNNPSS